ncbi:hypothetical protein F511_45471 [Dorcoceras hygrometricum]|uniref:Uncharacterized protein n=1 Tax=Dorcoceras hygrometricum TaxID=472368 RepID=A0A2Z6ZVX2_9LAMI|nr:hypothetical protein F511_45471 [Dorcoceras hygrometricum]
MMTSLLMSSNLSAQLIFIICSILRYIQLLERRLLIDSLTVLITLRLLTDSSAVLIIATVNIFINNNLRIFFFDQMLQQASQYMIQLVSWPPPDYKQLISTLDVSIANSTADSLNASNQLLNIYCEPIAEHILRPEICALE